MLARGFYDTVALWPTVAWPILISSAFWTFLRLCRMNEERYGFSVLSGRGAVMPAAWLYVAAGATFEAAMHLYLLWVVGWPYLVVAIPIYVIGWTVLPALLDDFGPALVLLPVLHATLAAAVLVLLGFVDIGVLRTANAELYGLLRGRAVAL